MSSEWVDLPLATQAGEGASSFVSDADLINLALIPSAPGAPFPFALMNTPALVNSAGSGAGLIRGMLAHGDYIWFVKGTGLYTWNGTVEAAVVGSIAGTALCQMTGTGINQIVIVADSATYKADTGTITTITPPAGTYTDATYQDGYTIYTRSGTDEFYVSAIDDPTTIAALDFSTADAIPDRLTGCVSDHHNLVLFGEKHIEFWYNSGGADFPFARSSPGVVERGCKAVGSIVKYDSAVFFLGDDRRVYRLEGFRAAPISTEWVERLITPTYANADVRGGVYVANGHAYYVLGLGAGLATVVYSITTGLWHRRDHNGISTPRFVDVCNGVNNVALPYAYAAVNYGALGEVFLLDEAVFRDSDAGTNDTLRTTTIPMIDGGGVRVFHHELEIIMEKGSVGTVTFSYSDDGGVSYTTHSQPSLNQDRLLFNGLGSFYRRILRFVFSANTRIALVAVRARISRGVA